VQKWRSLSFSLVYCFPFVYLDKHASIFTKKGNEHTWRKETDGGADLPCCLWALLRRSVSPCFSVSISSCNLPLRFNLLVLRRRRRWWCYVLCFTVSSASVRFAFFSPSSFSPLCLLSISPLPQFFNDLLSCLPPVFSPRCHLSSLVSFLSFFLCPLVFGSSSGFYSERTQAFMVSGRESRWRGMSAAICAPWFENGSIIAANVSCPLLSQTHNCWRQWIALQCKRSLNFLQFCNQTPDKIVIGSLNFGAFSGLVLGFGLCQLSP
jgi:hypothetical protein